MKLPDHSRWSNPDNYRQHWSLRAAAAAELVPNGMSVLEIGTGTGFFRDYVQDRCIYVGADLYPLDDTVLAINLDSDQLPEGKFDYVVLLGVFEYLHEAESAIDKVCSVSTDVVCSYCCLPKCRLTARSYQNRKKSGWVKRPMHTEVHALSKELVR